MISHQLVSKMVDLRRALHRHPETGLHLPRTQQAILESLEGLDIEITAGDELSSVVGVIRGGPGPTVLLRGDMDALPLTESTDHPLRSEIDGVMHACGHDLHVAALVGAAVQLCERRDELTGNVVLMFQPGEEGHDGAGAMLAQGVLDASGDRPIAAYALHVTSGNLPMGQFAGRTGAMMAASDTMAVTVHGRGGHGSTPHLAQDPVPIACEMIQAMHTMVTRRFDVFDPVVVTVGSLHSGTQNNIIPDSTWFDATIRSFSARSSAQLSRNLPNLMTKIAEAHGLTAEVVYNSQYPVMVNTGDELEFSAQVVGDLFGSDAFQRIENPLSSSEDFARVLQDVPGAYVMVGACPEHLDWRSAPYNHSPAAQFDDEVLARCAEYLTEMAIRRLRLASGSELTAMTEAAR